MCVLGSKIFALFFLSVIEALGGEIVEVYCIYGWFSIFMSSAAAGSTSMDSTNHGLKIFGGKFFSESFKKKKNRNLPCPGNYLHSIYIVMCIITKSRDDLKYMEE